MVFLIIIIFFLTRLIGLLNFPIFADEAIYIRWSQYILHDWGKLFVPLTDGKPPLHMWLMVPFLKFISDPLLAGRLFSVCCGLSSLLGIYMLTKELFSSKAAKISAILYLFLPFSLTYDRMALTDGVLLSFMIWFIYFLIMTVKYDKLKYSFYASIFLGLALLTKPTGIFFFPFLLFSLILVEKKKLNKKKLIKLIMKLLMIIIVSLMLYGILYFSPLVRFIYNRSRDYSFTVSEFINLPVYTLKLTLGKIIPWSFTYYTWPVMIAFLFGVLLGVLKKRQDIIFLTFCFLELFLINTVFGKVIYPRYFLVFLPLIIPIASYIIDKLLFAPKIKFRFGLLIILLIPSLYFDYFLIFRPLKTPFVPTDRVQHLTDWSSGIGIREIADYFKKMPNRTNNFVYTEGFFGTLPDGLAIFLNNYGIGVDGIGNPVVGIPQAAFDKMDKGYNVYLVANSTRVNIKDPRAVIIKEFPKPAREEGTIEKLILFKINK